MEQSLQNLQNQFLKELRENKTPISIFLVNGVRLHGCVEFFDNYIVAVRNEVTQLVYKHSISTVMPAGAETPHRAHRKEHDGNQSVTVRTKRSRSSGPTEG